MYNMEHYMYIINPDFHILLQIIEKAMQTISDNT